MSMTTEPTDLSVDLGDRSYPIRIGLGLLDDPEHLAGQLAGRTAIVVSDENVAPLYLDRALKGALGAAARSEALVLPAGERHKTIETWQRVLQKLIDSGAQRDAVLVTLGGGVVGDLCGFAAAAYMRGIDFIQCPTTLLAQVDSSVGGKTAVNHPRGKNLIGAFHQPRAVLIDVGTLDTLSEREYAAGLAETVKYGIIGSPGFFDWMERRAPALAAREPRALIEAVRRACQAKAEIVIKDEREAGVRALLNLGHTFGHALETETDYERLLHGEAVAIGMCLAARLAAALGRCPADVPLRLATLLQYFGLPTEVPDDLSPDALWHVMQLDKKNLAGRVRLVLPTAIGHAVIDDTVDEASVLAVLRNGREVAGA